MRLSEFGVQLRKIRIDNGERQKDMASRLGVCQSTLSAVESGTRNVPKGMVEKVIKEYNISEKGKKEIYKSAENSITSVKINLKGCTKRQRAAIIALGTSSSRSTRGSISELS
ncbi:helix-turn-helix transcriptional regulator [Bacteroides acidifaciens]|uniref:helix-turn-helix domain-containing protein n=1 Tax=Bacteroides acidifaciens TaxID=85831 RepID=UPI00248BB448|nr:helix-turn-helix transcriptional regulator [Bacteroides acidifaciens]